MENIPVLTIQDPLAVAGAVVLDCRPPLFPVSMDISGVDLSAIRVPPMSAGAVVLPPSRCSVGGLAWFDLSGVGCYSTGRPWNGR